MPYLQLSFQANFRPLIKLNKTQMKLVEHTWHHAILSTYNLIPTKQNPYNNLEINSEDVLYITRVYGIRPFWCEDPYSQLTDDEIYRFACR